MNLRQMAKRLGYAIQSEVYWTNVENQRIPVGYEIVPVGTPESKEHLHFSGASFRLEQFEVGRSLTKIHPKSSLRLRKKQGKDLLLPLTLFTVGLLLSKDQK